MQCPICGKEMEEGGLIGGGVTLQWFPQKQFGKRGLRRLLYTGGKAIGKSNVLLSQTRVPGAFYCSDCNKVAGVFDVVESNSV